MTNNCTTTKIWYVPLMDAVNTWVTVTVQGNISCSTYGWDKNGNNFFSNSATGTGDIVLQVNAPGGGTGELDCYVPPGGKVITVSW